MLRSRKVLWWAGFHVYDKDLVGLFRNPIAVLGEAWQVKTTNRVERGEIIIRALQHIHGEEPLLLIARIRELMDMWPEET